MKVIMGWMLGVATTCAALAIWRRLPGLPNVDPEPEYHQLPGAGHVGKAGSRLVVMKRRSYSLDTHRITLEYEDFDGWNAGD